MPQSFARWETSTSLSLFAILVSKSILTGMSKAWSSKMKISESGPNFCSSINAVQDYSGVSFFLRWMEHRKFSDFCSNSIIWRWKVESSPTDECHFTATQPCSIFIQTTKIHYESVKLDLLVIIIHEEFPHSWSPRCWPSNNEFFSTFSSLQWFDGPGQTLVSTKDDVSSVSQSIK